MALEKDNELLLYVDALHVSQKLVASIKQGVNEILLRRKLDYRHWQALKVIYYNDAKTPSNIASLICIDKPRVSRITDDLVAAELVERNRNAVDRREVQLTITKEGISVVKEGLEIFPSLFKKSVTQKELGILSAIEKYCTH